MEQEESAYITSLHLKGYKSIRDVSVTLNKGLNILIGANGSGKTNFLEFLKHLDSLSYLPKNCEVEITNSKGFTQLMIPKELEVFKRLKKDGIIVGEKIFYSFEAYSLSAEIGKNLEDKELIPTEYEYLSFHFVKIDFDNHVTNLFKIAKGKYIIKISPDSTFWVEKEDNKGSSNVNYYWQWTNIAHPHNFFISLLLINTNFISEDVKQKATQLINYLKSHTSIKGVRINMNGDELFFESEIDEKNETIYFVKVKDFYKKIEFYLHGRWSNFDEISDGTKRIFYLFFQTFYSSDRAILLIEEPELGVHPHQLALLMNFLKSQSRDKQIIISTHSPQVLNCLGEDELDRIIVARHEGKTGTKLYHLSEREQKLASEFMINEAFLSDYWMLSGFMNEEMPEEV